MRKKRDILGDGGEVSWDINKRAFFGAIVTLRGVFLVSKSGRFRFEMSLPFNQYEIAKEFRACLGGAGSLSLIRLEKRPYCRLTVQSYRDIAQFLIPFLQGNVRFSKREVFERWCQKFFERLEEKYEVDLKKLADVLGFVPGFSPTNRTPYPCQSPAPVTPSPNPSTSPVPISPPPAEN